jgi:hypothetical protein
VRIVALLDHLLDLVSTIMATRRARRISRPIAGVAGMTAARGATELGMCYWRSGMTG